MNKKISTTTGIIAIIVLVIIVIGGVFAYQYYRPVLEKENLYSQSPNSSETEQVEMKSSESDNQKTEEINKFEETNEPEEINTSSGNLNIIDKLVNWGYQTPLSNRSIDTVIVHSSYDALGSDPYSVDGVIYEYKLYSVSPHYLIDRNGTIFRLVEDKDIAYHAGSGRMKDGRDGINIFSIGIEIINTKTVGPNEVQYLSLVELLKFLKSKYEIKYILGHNEIAPERKTDPWNFDWQKFNEMLNY